jgi:hypothetical protein
MKKKKHGSFINRIWPVEEGNSSHKSMKPAEEAHDFHVFSLKFDRI